MISFWIIYKIKSRTPFKLNGLKETDSFYLDWVNKQEMDDIKKETKGFGAKLKDFIVEIKRLPEEK